MPTPTITPWPGISRGTLWTVPIVPGLVSVIVAPWKSLDRQLVRLHLADQLLVRGEEPGEVEGVGVAQHRARRGCAPPAFSTSTARPMLTCSLRTRRGLPSLPSTNVPFIVRHRLGDRAHDRPADEVGEADLALPGAAAVAVDHLAVDLEQLGGDVAEAGRGRDREALRHVRRDGRAGAADRLARVLAAAPAQLPGRRVHPRPGRWTAARWRPARSRPVRAPARASTWRSPQRPGWWRRRQRLPARRSPGPSRGSRRRTLARTRSPMPGRRGTGCTSRRRARSSHRSPVPRGRSQSHPVIVLLRRPLRS